MLNKMKENDKLFTKVSFNFFSLLFFVERRECCGGDDDFKLWQLKIFFDAS